MNSEDLPVSISWSYPRIKNDKCTAYCFAYVRDPKTFNVLYAGVKYEGNFSNLKEYKASLRKTAVERLIKKPIYSVFSLGTDEEYKKNLNDKNHRFNGFDIKEKCKKSNALSKFFLYCALNQKFSDLGICASKKNSDMKLSYANEKIEIFKNQHDSRISFVRFGYEYKGEEMKRITINNSIGDIILNLRRRAKFYGKEKERVPLDYYYDINKAYFIQFGINKEKIHRKQKIDFELKDYQKDQKVIYYRVNLSNNVRAHIAFMKFINWENFVCETYGQEFQFDLSDNNAYCVGYSLENINEETNFTHQGKRNLYRSIAIDRMIDRPNIISAKFFEIMDLKDIRIWFAKKIYLLNKTTKIPYGAGTVYFKEHQYVWENDEYRVLLSLYEPTVKRGFLKRVMQFFGLI